MILIPDKSGETKATLTVDRPGTSFPLTVSVANKYSVWTSSKNGTVRLFREFDLHRPIVAATQKLVVELEPGNYFVSLAGDIGTFTLNVTSIKPAATPEPQKPQAILEAEAEIHAEG